MKKLYRSVLALLLVISCIASELLASNMPSYVHLSLIMPISWLAKDGQLILSNSPETVKEQGLLYQDELLGKGRIVYHHVNSTGMREVQLVIWMVNPTSESCLLTLEAKGHKGPSGHYLRAGHEALMDYHFSKQNKSLVIAPYEKQILYCSSPEGWPIGSVLTGMIDIAVTQKVNIYIALISKEYTMEQMESGQLLEKSREERGNFPTLTICHEVYLPNAGSCYYLIEADKEKWLQGYDPTTHQKVINYGNYGIIYKISIHAMATTKVFLCPRGGIFQGMVKWENGEVSLIDRLHVFKVKKEPITIAHLSAGETRTFEYILPCGSAAPVLVGFLIENKN